MTGSFGRIKAPTANNGTTMHELVNQAAESAATAKATITPVPNGGWTGKFKAYAVLTSLWFVSAVTSLFLDGDGFAYKVTHAIAYTSVVILAFWVLRPPVQYKPLVEAAK